jgi:ABC-2 type transport system ATP-binding protein
MIRLQHLTKRFGATVAVDRLTVDIESGRVTGFLGPNGAGKSTTLRLILGLDRPTAGSATVNGRAYRDLPAPVREVGALLDAKAVHGARTARQHLRWVARAGGVPATRVDDVLDQVGLAAVAERRISGFSLGMAQRLGIATALLGDPAVLLFDEPINGLDPDGIRWVRTLLRQLATEGRTVVVSSHLMSEMEDTADHVIVIGRGRLVADADVSDLTASRSAGIRVVSPRAEELIAPLAAAGAVVARDHRANGDGTVLMVTGIDAPRIPELAVALGVPLHELTPQRASLESVFMDLTNDSLEFEGVRA